ncbi:MAG: hypothetical protein R8K50_06640 [Mariprofundus sp.]
MKRIGLLLLLTTLGATATTAENLPYQAIKKGCMMISDPVEMTKNKLLLQVKSAVRDELYQRARSSNTKGSGLYFFRIKGKPLFSSGKNKGEICVQIQAYLTTDHHPDSKQTTTQQLPATEPANRAQHSGGAEIERGNSTRAKDQPDSIAKQLKGKRGPDRYNAINNIIDTLNNPLSAETLALLLTGIDNYRQNTVTLIKQKLPDELTDAELQLLLADTRGGERYNIIAAIAARLAHPLSMESLALLLANTGSKIHYNTVITITEKLPDTLSPDAIRLLLSNTEGATRYNTLVAIADRLAKPVPQVVLDMILKDIGDYRENAMQSIQ